VTGQRHHGGIGRATLCQFRNRGVPKVVNPAMDIGINPQVAPCGFE
jgi:hypothetical protein